MREKERGRGEIGRETLTRESRMFNILADGLVRKVNRENRAKLSINNEKIAQN
jgi:hypothetical protein